MKSLVYKGPENVVLCDTAKPEPLPGEVLIRVKATGICGSDTHEYFGTTGRRIAPMIMGHEFSGEVAETTQSETTLKPGDRVTVQPLIFCGKCGYCRQGLTNLCKEKKMFGILNINGSMAEYISVPEYLIYRLPDSISHIHGAMLEPLAVAYSAARHAPDIRGKNVLIVGAGTIGLLLLQIVKDIGPAQVFVSDINDFRLGLASKLGADYTLNPKTNNCKQVIEEKTGNEGVDVAFEAVGISQTVQQAMLSLRIKGSCVWIGNASKWIEVNMQEIVTRELSVFGTYAYTHKDFGDVIRLLSERRFDLDTVISRVAPIEEGPEMFRKLTRESEQLVKVILTL